MATLHKESDLAQKVIFQDIKAEYLPVSVADIKPEAWPAKHPVVPDLQSRRRKWYSGDHSFVHLSFLSCAAVLFVSNSLPITFDVSSFSSWGFFVALFGVFYNGIKILMTLLLNIWIVAGDIIRGK